MQLCVTWGCKRACNTTSAAGFSSFSSSWSDSSSERRVNTAKSDNSCLSCICKGKRSNQSAGQTKKLFFWGYNPFWFLTISKEQHNITVYFNLPLIQRFKYATDAKADVSIKNSTNSWKSCQSRSVKSHTLSNTASLASGENFLLHHCHMATMWRCLIKNFSHKGTDSTICRVSTTPHFTEWSSCVKLLAVLHPTQRGRQPRWKIAV